MDSLGRKNCLKPENSVVNESHPIIFCADPCGDHRNEQIPKHSRVGTRSDAQLAALGGIQLIRNPILNPIQSQLSNLPPLGVPQIPISNLEALSVNPINLRIPRKPRIEYLYKSQIYPHSCFTSSPPSQHHDGHNIGARTCWNWSQNCCSPPQWAHLRLPAAMAMRKTPAGVV